MRLYYDDPLLTRFDAQVVALAARGVVLDRSAFYPESGGQMGDRGSLEVAGSQHAVDDVQLVDGAVVHVVAADIAVGTRLVGHVDRARRRVHMALHTGQHILSRALSDVAQANTLSARLGETACTIDVDRDRIDDAVLGRVEDLANAVIDDDVPVRAHFPDEATLERLPLRREAKVVGPIRVVEIGDFDVTPCGGTHCLRSAQVGLLSIHQVERYKRGSRITFSAGERARRQLGREAAALRELARRLSCASADVGPQLDKLRRELADANEALRAGRALLAEQLSASLGEDDVVVHAFDGIEVALLREIAKRVCEARPSTAVLLASFGDATQLVISRGSDSVFDCAAFLARVKARAPLRGGGRADRAEGRIDGRIDWPTLARALLSDGDAS